MAMIWKKNKITGLSENLNIEGKRNKNNDLSYEKILNSRSSIFYKKK